VDIVKDFYENYYSKVSSNQGTSSFFNSLAHKKLESNYKHAKNSADNDFSVMEIGARQGEHIEYVKHGYSSYLMVDVVPHSDLPRFSPKVAQRTADICAKDLNFGTFDRTTSTCIFHHLEDPVIAIENIKKHLKPSGTFSLFLPSDPGVLNRWLKKLCVTPTVNKFGFKYYEVVNAREYKNHYWSLKTNLNFQFRNYKITKNIIQQIFRLGNSLYFLNGK
jgi:SAM-dependent methyltransferase